MSVGVQVRPASAVGARFVAAFALAQVGAYLSFVPLLQILVPLKAAALDPAHKTVLLSEAAFWGAITASLSNLFAGALSDRTTSRFGRRRPWLVGGLFGTVFAYWLIFQAGNGFALLLGVVVFQLTFNGLFAALAALIPDQVPDAQKGEVAAFASLGFPVGSVLGAYLIGRMIQSEPARFLALGLVVSAAVAPLLLNLRDPPVDGRAAPPRRWQETLGSFWVDPRAHPDFAFAWSGRFLVVLANSLVQAYVLFYLQDAVHYSRLFPGREAEAGLAILTAVACATNVAAALLSGFLSDRIGRRKPFVLLGSLMLAGCMAILALVPHWGAVVAAYLLYGLGMGCYYAADLALITQVLPRARDAGKDLGIVNLSNTLPQAVAPMAAVGLLGGPHADYRALFLAAAAVAAIGGLLVLPIRKVR